jgi:threonine dehydrogenase-like Zn-dependent dehydrogenase
VAAGITGFIYGHEFAGVDDNGTGYFVEPNIYGGKCEQCQTIITHRYPIDDAQEASGLPPSAMPAQSR